MLHLSLVPFMSSKRPLDKQIEKTVQTLDKIRTNQECKSDFAFGIELLIVEKFIKEERQHKKLTSILRDTMKVVDEWLEEEFKKGEKNGLIKTAKNMIEENYTIEEIMKITKLNKETILNL